MLRCMGCSSFCAGLGHRVAKSRQWVWEECRDDFFVLTWHLGLTLYVFSLHGSSWVSVILEAGSNPWCRGVSEFVVLVRGVSLRSGVGSGHLWLLRGGIVSSLSSICYLPGYWFQSHVGILSTYSYRVLFTLWFCVILNRANCWIHGYQRFGISLVLEENDWWGVWLVLVVWGVSLSLMAQSPFWHIYVPQVYFLGSVAKL